MDSESTLGLDQMTLYNMINVPSNSTVVAPPGVSLYILVSPSVVRVCLSQGECVPQSIKSKGNESEQGTTLGWPRLEE